MPSPGQAWKLDTFEAFAAYLRILSFRGTTPNSNIHRKA